MAWLIVLVAIALMLMSIFAQVWKCNFTAKFAIMRMVPAASKDGMDDKEGGCQAGNKGTHNAVYSCIYRQVGQSNLHPEASNVCLQFSVGRVIIRRKSVSTSGLEYMT